MQAPELLQARRDFLGIRARVDRGFLVLGLRVAFHGHLLGRARARIGDLFVRVDEARDQVLQAGLAAQDLVVRVEDQLARLRELNERAANLIEAFLDALRDPDLALAREQLDRAHLAHVHANRVRRAAELGVDGRERRGSLVGCVVVVRDRVV